MYRKLTAFLLLVLLVAWARTALAAPMDNLEGWFAAEARSAVARCAHRTADGLTAYAPDASGHYKAAWMRDFTMMLEGDAGVYGNTIGFYAYDPGAADRPYTIPWSGEGNASTRFRITKSGTTYQLKHGEINGALADATSYTFVGTEPIGSGPCLVGVSIADPNLATLPQIAPIRLRVSTPGLSVILR